VRAGPGRWGFDGFSVFEVPAGDYAHLARLVPIVALRPKLYWAQGAALLDAGFPLFPTRDFPHWTVVLSEATPASSRGCEPTSPGRSTTRRGRARDDRYDG